VRVELVLQRLHLDCIFAAKELGQQGLFVTPQVIIRERLGRALERERRPASKPQEALTAIFFDHQVTAPRQIDDR